MSAATFVQAFVVTHARLVSDNESAACDATTGAASLDWREVNCKDRRCAFARGTYVQCKPATAFADAWPGVYVVLGPMVEAHTDPKLAAVGYGYVPSNFKLIRANKVRSGEPLPDADDYDVILHAQRLERLNAPHKPPRLSGHGETP